MCRVSCRVCAEHRPCGSNSTDRTTQTARDLPWEAGSENPVCRVDRRLAPPGPTAALTVTLTEATEVLASGGTLVDTATRQVHAQRADSDSAPLRPLRAPQCSQAYPSPMSPGSGLGEPESEAECGADSESRSGPGSESQTRTRSRPSSERHGLPGSRLMPPTPTEPRTLRAGSDGPRFAELESHTARRNRDTRHDASRNHGAYAAHPGRG